MANILLKFCCIDTTGFLKYERVDKIIQGQVFENLT